MGKLTYLAYGFWLGGAAAFTTSRPWLVSQSQSSLLRSTPFRRSRSLSPLLNMVSNVGDPSYAVSFTTSTSTNHLHQQHAPSNITSPIFESTVVVSSILESQLASSSTTLSSAAAFSPVEYSSFVNAVPSPTTSLSVMQGRLIVLVAAAIFGTNFSCIKFLDGVLPLAESAAIRFSLAAVAVTAGVLMCSSTSSTNTDMKDEMNIHYNDLQSFSLQQQLTSMSHQLEPWCRGGEVGLWYCVGYLSQASGLHFVDASKSAFFNALAVLVVPLLDCLFKHKKLGWAGVASMLTALGGVALLQLGPHAHAADAALSTLAATTTSTTNSFFDPMIPWLSLGDLFCLAQAIFFGIGYWRLEEHSTKYPSEAGPITAGQLLAIAIGSIAYWAYTSTAGSSTSTILDVASSLSHMGDRLSDPLILSVLVWTGLVSTALALWLETVALSVVSATELTLLMTSVSLWGSLFAFLFAGETLSTTGMLGGLLILSGCVLTSLSKEHSKDISPAWMESPTQEGIDAQP